MPKKCKYLSGLQSCFLCVFLFVYSTVIGQFDDNNIKVEVQHWSVKDGLSHRNVRSVYHDSQGFIWIGTAYGLNRFDGQQFKVFSKEKDSLANNEVFFIEEDEEGWLWLASDLNYSNNRSLTFINVHTYEIVSLKERFGDSFPIDINELETIKSDDNRAIYISGAGKIYQYKNEKFNLLLDGDEPVFITNCNDDKLLAYKRTTPNSIEAFELDNGVYNNIGQFKTTLTPRVLLFNDPNENTWIATFTEIYLQRKGELDWQQQLSELTRKKDTQATFIISPQKHSQYKELIWFGSEDNLVVTQAGEDFSLDIGTNYPEIPRANIKHIYFDRYDNAWVITAMGVYKIKIRESLFKNHLNQPLENYNIKKTFSTRGMMMMEGKLWVNSGGTEQHLIDLENNTIEDLSIPDELDISPLEKPLFFPIIAGGKSDFYTADSHVVKYKNGKPTNVYHWKRGELIANSWSIFKNKEKIWLGLWERGLAVLEKDSIAIYRQLNEFKTLSESEVYHFYKWTEENILLATSNGIYALHPEKGIIQRFWTGGAKETRIPSDRIYHMNRDNEDENILWVASAGGGLLRLNLDPKGLKINAIEQFTALDGLSHNVLYAVYPDDYQNLWIPSDYGLIRFNKLTNKCKIYLTADGLPINEFNRISHYQATDGQLFFGTINGLTTFHPRDLTSENKAFDRPLRVTRFQQFNGDKNELEDRTAELALHQKIVLQPNDKFLTLNFTLLEYNDPSQVKYSYQIKGQDKQWIYLSDNELHLNGLPYGQFILNVRAQSGSGQFSSQVLSIPIMVKMPFYLMWWFFTLIFIGLAIGLYFWYSTRTRALRERQKELEQEVGRRTAKIEKDKQTIEQQAVELKDLDQIKSRFFANISHELRTPLTLILAPVKEILAENQLDKKTILNLQYVERNSQKLKKMVNEILDLSKLESSKMMINSISIHWHQFLKRIYASFESLADMKAIDYQFQYEGYENIHISIDKQKVETILNNLLSNAFKFTPNQGQVHIHATVLERQLNIEIKDNGRGIASEDLPNIFNRFYQTKNKNQIAEGGTGIGLALSQELAKLLKGTIEVASEQGKQTIFKLQLPLEIVEKSDLEPIQKEIIPIVNEQSFAPFVLPQKEKTPKNTSNTILLVEDNLDLLLFVQSLLEVYYTVITASNGQEALKKLNQYPNIQLIISDVMMPVMDGFQLLKQLKTNKKYQNIPVVMLTARASLGDKLNALRIGVDDYLTKPFIKEELLARIDNLLRNAQGRKDAQALELENSVESVLDIEPAITNLQDEETQQWLDDLEQVVLKNIAFADFTVDSVASEMFTSKRQLYRKIQQHIGITPLQYIKTYKLNYARDLLVNNKVSSVKSAAYSIGYSNVVYFRREFKKAFGRLPSYYLL